ncbi:MAG: bifunctional hydroxymethylpyrimidine kinase/phosphomethylpyrimidine kinase [Treponema sp.]|jgi:pyridoxine kinase|nr:bifunctional hydroxymethylpyrimidine kinase/phosphomethylpyrimidine kinase [Treponema sp.]
MFKVLTIAGSDASGGAGLEADLKTFEEYGVYGMAAVTVIATMDPDNTWAHAVFPTTETALRAQLETAFKGVGVNAVKSGMLGSFDAVALTAEYLRTYSVPAYVLDPVMVCKGAKEALNPALNSAIADELLPLAQVVTPNLFEAEQLSGLADISTIDQMKEAAQIIFKKGVQYVFIKGGAKLPHQTRAIDILFDGTQFDIVEDELLRSSWTHGAGCTVSAAITAGLARGLPVREAVFLAKKFITTSLRGSFALNQWVGPGNPSGWRNDTLFGSR